MTITHSPVVHVVSRATDLPFQIDDAGRSEAEAAATGLPVVNQDTALNFRCTFTPFIVSIFFSCLLI